VAGRVAPEPDHVDRVSYVLTQGEIRLVVTGAIEPGTDVGAFVQRHGDGVRDIALVVDDPAGTHTRAIAAGAQDASSGVGPASGPPVVGTFGDTMHTLLTPSSAEPFSHLEPVAVGRSNEPAVGLRAIDHFAISVGGGEREVWAQRYERGLGFRRRPDDEHIDVGGSAFSMTTVGLPESSAAFVFAEPRPSTRKSQIASYLDSFDGAGVHHVAFATDDVATTVRALQHRGFRTLPVPASYSHDAEDRLAEFELPWRELADLGILVDFDDDGYLLQAFTEPLGDRPTTYVELIQREGTDGFGTDNVRYLYSEVVRQQDLLDARRGTSTTAHR
jgi:4-hydroxyphenylpyruvate dioxygenase